MELGELISFYRKQAGLTLDDLAEQSRVPKGTITKILSGTTKAPTLDNIKAIAHALGRTLEDFDDDPRATSLFSPSEQSLIRKYRDLDDHGKNAVIAVLDCEKARCDDAKARPATERIVEIFPTRKYNQSAAAGYGDFNDDRSYTEVDLVRRPPIGTSFLIVVSGNSMEPTYSDGDVVFVKSQSEIKEGEIGLFTRGGDLFIKESGNNCLLSHNPTYDPIYPTDDTDIIVQGKILGVCTPDYMF